MKKNTYKYIFEICFIITLLFNTTTTSFSQQPIKQNWQNKVDSLYNISGMKQITNQVQPKNGWLYYKDSLKFEKNSFFKNQAKEFGLKTDDQIEVSKTETDGYGMEHVKYHQRYKGYVVEFSDLIVHSKNGYALKSNGTPYLDLNVNIRAKISAQEAINIALKHINAIKYAWEETNGQKMSEYPKPELVILPRNENLGTEKDYFAYKIDLYTVMPYYHSYVYVDAESGKVVFENNRLRTNEADGKALTKYSGTVDIKCDLNFPDYTLTEDGINKITTKNNKNQDNYNNAQFYTTKNYYGDQYDYVGYWYDLTNPNDPNSQKLPNAAFDAHWAAEQTLNYYRDKFGRDSYDGRGGPITNYVHTDLVKNYGFKSNANAFWDPSNNGNIFYGDGDADHSECTSIDIVAHEITHGVTHYTAGFLYSSESGALDEGFSDIFGNSVKYFIEGDDDNWKIGEKISKKDIPVPLRDMENPMLSEPPQPNGYGTGYQYWHPSWDSGDNYGVHTNSGVLNRWFYLLSDGNLSPMVSGIGRESAEQIAYRALSYYLISSSNYANARQATIEAACDIFGECSNQAVQVVNAWNAVNVQGPTNINSDITVPIGNIGAGEIEIATNNIYTTLTSTQSTFIVNNTSVVFRAGNSIILKPGFTASNGCNFKAWVYNCNGGSIIKSARIKKEDTNALIKNKIPSDKSVNDLHIFPNPTQGKVNIQISKPTDQTVSVQLYDTAGRLIYKQAENQSSFEIDLSKELSGIYILKVISGSNVFIKKITKQ